MMKSGSRTFSAIGESVIGANHVRNGTPCQDALRIDNGDEFTIVSISDGHGSAACPFSNEGAQAAVDSAYAVFSSIIEDSGDPFHTISSNKDIWLPKQIEQHWKNEIIKIHNANKREEYPQESFPYELYGATLISLVAADNFIFALQLGDGDILSITPMGDINDYNDDLVDMEFDENPPDPDYAEIFTVEWFLPPDTTLGPETNSLCQDNCWQHVKTKMLPVRRSDNLPMIMLSTDGYANSFNSDNGFKKAGADFFTLIYNHGLVHVEDNLEDWLTESSVRGSGDDITVAFILEDEEFYG